MLRNLFLMEMEITCLLKRDLNWWNRNTKWNLLTIVLMRLSRKLMLSDWNCRTPITDALNIEENKVRLQEESVRKEKALQDTQIRCMHEMGEMKRAQELQVNENSLYRSWEKVMKQYRDSLHKDKNFKKGWIVWMTLENSTKWNYSGQCSYVPSQLAGVPSLRSTLSCDKRLQLDTWNLSGTQGNVLAHPRSTFESSQKPYRGILHFTTPNATHRVPVRICTGALVARDEERIGSTILMPTFASRPSTMNSFMPVEIPEFYCRTAKTADIGTAIW